MVQLVNYVCRIVYFFYYFCYQELYGIGCWKVFKRIIIFYFIFNVSQSIVGIRNIYFVSGKCFYVVVRVFLGLLFFLIYFYMEINRFILFFKFFLSLVLKFFVGCRVNSRVFLLVIVMYIFLG